MENKTFTIAYEVGEGHTLTVVGKQEYRDYRDALEGLPDFKHGLDVERGTTVEITIYNQVHKEFYLIP